MNRDEQEAMI